jgi:hypothetical protein
MPREYSFTPEEWTKILVGTMLAGMAISAADPSELWGLIKEGAASYSAMAAAKSDAGSNELVKAVVADFETRRGDPLCVTHCASGLPEPSRPMSCRAR